MASSDTTLQSTLESLCKYSANHVDDDYLKLSRDIAFLMDSTTKKESLRTINTFHEGQSISSLLDVLKSNPSGDPPVDILYKTLMILGRVLSVSPSSIFQSRFLDHDGIAIIYDDIVSSPQHSNNQDMVYGMVDFLCSLSTNHEVGLPVVVHNSEDHLFLFEMSRILSKRLSYSHCVNKFVNLLSRLYRQDIGRNKKEEALSDDDDDEDSIRSILNTLISTGFLKTVSKRIAMLKSGNKNDIVAMTNLMMVLIDCNAKKCTKYLVNAQIPKQLLLFLGDNASSHEVSHKLIECLLLFHRHSPDAVRNQLEEGQYQSVLSVVTAQSKYALLSAIDPSYAKSPNSIIPDNVSVQSSSDGTVSSKSTLSDDDDVESMEDNTSPDSALTAGNGMNAMNGGNGVNGCNGRRSMIVPAGPPPRSSMVPQGHRGTLTQDQMNGVITDIQKKVNSLTTGTNPSNRGRVSDGGSEDLLNTLSDMQSAIKLLQNSMSLKRPKGPQIRKYITPQQFAPRDSGVEAQHFIDAETERIV